MNRSLVNALIKASNIAKSGLSIYDTIEFGDNNLWFLSEELEEILNSKLIGLNLAGLPLRTRSKVIKESVCRALGYGIPKSFKKAKPRFQGQNFDTYGQKRNNLQVWNEEISPTRRYVLIDISEEDIVRKIKVVSGDMVSKLDNTGKLTKKYQAQLKIGHANTELISNKDSSIINEITVRSTNLLSTGILPTDNPSSNTLLSISSIYERLCSIVGKSFADLGRDQERNRGADLQKLVCKHLGYCSYADNGKLPDVRHQLLEVKLQTSPTIDLGAFKPDSTEALDMPQIDSRQVCIKDLRYAIFYATIEKGMVVIKNFYLVTGEDFFSRFPQMMGNEVNGKLQIPLPRNFFDTSTYKLTTYSDQFVAEDTNKY